MIDYRLLIREKEKCNKREKQKILTDLKCDTLCLSEDNFQKKGGSLWRVIIFSMTAAITIASVVIYAARPGIGMILMSSLSANRAKNIKNAPFGAKKHNLIKKRLNRSKKAGSIFYKFV